MLKREEPYGSLDFYFLNTRNLPVSTERTTDQPGTPQFQNLLLHTSLLTSNRNARTVQTGQSAVWPGFPYSYCKRLPINHQLASIFNLIFHDSTKINFVSKHQNKAAKSKPG